MESKESKETQTVLNFEEKDRIGALVQQMFGLWQGNFAVVILTGLTEGAELTTG